MPVAFDRLRPAMAAPVPPALLACRLLTFWIAAWVALSAGLPAGEPQSEGGQPPVDHPPAVSPDEALTQFEVAEGLEIRLVVAEPDVFQPLAIRFDDRGRMWVLEYRQYPNPNGLTPVEMDHWLRTRYDRVPEPPPDGPQGDDRISIYEDTTGDGRPDSIKHFLTDLNLASGMALGDGGVFVVQPPYLLFYADRDGDDVPDGPPEVLLKGFGMEDAHAFANSLTWGPDGWLYGAQGSTVTADIRGIGFQQGVWRYHPVSREFELFAEGGGNTWGVEFDRYGNLFAAGNTVEPLVHHVQGAYYVKGFGKHGPLHNPHAYGYFQPVEHHGYAGDSLTGGAVIYQGGAFPERFDGACIAPNTRHSACRWSTLETRGSTFATRAAGDFVTSRDIWFRPVNMAVGPDGAIYIADWYDHTISHSSPRNRSEWYQPSREDGRIWRVAPPDLPPVPSGSFDLGTLSNDALVGLLSHANDWYARQARRILAERADPSAVPALAKLLDSPDQRLALQGLWSIFVSGGLDDELAARTLDSPHEYVRAWTVRLLGDAREVSPVIQEKLVHRARTDESPVVRSQLACTAKRLPGRQAIPLVEQLLRHDQDVRDVHIPLLVWWAIEDKAVSDTALVLRLVESPEAWRRPLVERVLIERLARRLAAEGTDATFAACARLLSLAPTDADSELVLSGMLKALSGRKLDAVPAPLQTSMARELSGEPLSPQVMELALRMNVMAAAERATGVVLDSAAPAERRISLIHTLGETRTAAAIQALLTLLERKEAEPIHSAALTALGYFQEDRIADVVLGCYERLGAGPQARAVELLCSRPRWAAALVQAVDRETVPAAALSLDQVRQVSEWDDERTAALIARHWGRIQPSTPLEMQGRVTAVSQMLARGTGDAGKGRVHFERLCADCHKLHGHGQDLGPDLTGAERKNRELLVRNVVDPSATTREQYIMHVAVTTDGRVLNGLLADSTAETITLLDAKNKRTVLNRDDLESLDESPISLMPERLLDPLTEQQIRDLFAYLQSQSDPASP